MRAMIGVLIVLASAATTQAAPATRPAGVLVLAFDPVVSGETINNAIGQGIQHSLLAELGRMRHLSGMLPASQPAADGTMVTPGAALAAGRAAGARYVVFGACQINGQQMRLTGQVLDVEREGAAVGLMKVTAGVGDLFEAQDALCLQLRRILPAPMMAVESVQSATRPMTAEERWPWRKSSRGGWQPAGYRVDYRGTQVDATMRRQEVWVGRPYGWCGWYGRGFGIY